MKVFVATRKGQGGRANDFSFTREGELVQFGDECDGEEVDGDCGCRRSMVGVESSKSTTTFCVAECDLDIDALVKSLVRSGRRDGWEGLSGGQEQYQHGCRRMAIELVAHAERFPVGVVLERRGDIIEEREIA